MAETSIIRIRDILSPDLRKQVEVFLEGEEVSVEDEAGRKFGVTIRKNRLLFQLDDGDMKSS